MNPETKLYRQVHRSWIQEGYVSSQAFIPTKKDNGELSVDHGDMVTARQSYDHFTQALGLSSEGVVSILYKECTEIGLPVEHDRAPYPSHCFVDFRNVPQTVSTRSLAKQLHLKAKNRGWEYRPAPAASA